MKTREQNIEKLKQLCKRLGIRPGDVTVRPKVGSNAGMVLTFAYRSVSISRACDLADSRGGNFNHLVNWKGDLVRNLERRIETLEEAFHADGVKRLPERADDWGGTLRESRYDGGKTVKEALELILHSAERLGLAEGDVRVTWTEEPNEAVLKLRLPNGLVMTKHSSLQEDPRRNVVALALWLRCRALHVERGIETLERVASPYLQLAAGGAS